MTETPSVRRALALSGLVTVDAQVLLAHALGRDRAWLVAHGDDTLSHEQADLFFALARRRREGEPVAYLVGGREFWGLALEVSPAVLIPRPETETLVEHALSRLPPDRSACVLDLGTGSGAIALALAHERPRARVIATDAYAPALAVARANAQRLRLANVAFRQGDWYAALEAGDGPFDVIASNPPYVAAGDPHLGQGDLPFEPPAALASGAQGLDALRQVIAGAPARLLTGGSLLVEHGYDQAEAVQRLMHEARLREVATACDLAGIARVTFGRFESEARRPAAPAPGA